MERRVSVDAPPATAWEAPLPSGPASRLWAGARPTEGTLARLALPGGTIVRGPGGQLLGWESHDGCRDLNELWLKTARQFPQTGLWPILDARRMRPTRGWDFLAEDGQPYWRDPYAVPTDVFDATRLPDRQDYLRNPGDDPDEHRQLMMECGLQDTSLTLAKASTLPEEPFAQLLLPASAERLTLVACRRPADAVLLLDFGVANDSATPGIFVGVLRSWEERFGLLPVMLQPAWTSFHALAPPTSEIEVERLAAEIFCFAEDTALQGGFYAESGRVREQQLAQSREWLIWWD